MPPTQPNLSEAFADFDEHGATEGESSETRLGLTGEIASSNSAALDCDISQLSLTEPQGLVASLSTAAAESEKSGDALMFDGWTAGFDNMSEAGTNEPAEAGTKEPAGNAAASKTETPQREPATADSADYTSAEPALQISGEPDEVASSDISMDIVE